MANYTWSVTNANGHDGDMVLRQYSSFNLSSGNTLTPSNDCRGVMIFVDGDATINGTITVRGAYGGTPADMTWNMIYASTGTQSLDNTTTNWGNGSTDANGILSDLSSLMNKMPNITSAGTILSTNSATTGDATGGTGWGGGATNEPQNSNNQGSPFSGGAGHAGDIDTTPSAATRYGGQGGDGRGGAYAMGAGAGNPGGSDPAGASGDHTGGLFVLCASGNINGSGTIDCSGSNGGYAGFTSVEVLYAYGGGGSGGGRIILVAGGTISSSITTNVNGGNGGGATSSKYGSYSGSRGNHGTVTKLAGVRT